MRTIPLAEGDLALLFRPDEMTPALLESLVGSSTRLVDIARMLPGGRSGWSGSGMEFQVFPSGQRCLSAWAENDQVTFEVELLPPGFYADRVPGQWQVSASISVRCDGTTDCGMHAVEESGPDYYPAASEAVSAVALASAWLTKRSQDVPPGDWRSRDSRAGHA